MSAVATATATSTAALTAASSKAGAAGARSATSASKRSTLSGATARELVVGLGLVVLGERRCELLGPALQRAARAHEVELLVDRRGRRRGRGGRRDVGIGDDGEAALAGVRHDRRAAVRGIAGGGDGRHGTGRLVAERRGEFREPVPFAHVADDGSCTRRATRGASRPGHGGPPGAASTTMAGWNDQRWERRWSSSARATSGCPVAVRAVEAGFDVVGLDVDDDRIDGLARRRTATSRTSPTSASPPPSPPAATAHHRPRRRCRASTSPSSPCRRRCATACPTSRYIEDAARDLAAAPAAPAPPWCSSRPPTPAPPRSWWRPILEEGSGPRRRRATSTSATAPSASIPATRRGRFENTPKVVSGVDAGVARRRAVVLRPAGRDDRAGRRRRRRPSSPSCSRTPSGTSTSPSSTSWRCSPATSASTSGRRSTPPPPSRSGTCGSRPGPASAATACRSTPSYLSWQVRQRSGATLPLRRARQRRQRAHARLRGAAGIVVHLNRPRPGREGPPHPAARPRLQAQHRRRPRERRATRSAPRLVALGRRRAGRRPPRRRRPGARPAPRWWRRPPRRWRPPTSWSCWSTTTGFDLPALVDGADHVLDTRRCVPARDGVEVL